HEGAAFASYAAIPAERDHSCFTLLERCERVRARAIELFEDLADCTRTVDLQQPRRTGADRGEPAVVIECEHAERRRIENHLEEVVLLLVSDTLVAQLVRHPVVDGDELVHFVVPRRPKARREIGVGKKTAAVAKPVYGDEEPSDELDADGERRDKRN